MKYACDDRHQPHTLLPMVTKLLWQRNRYLNNSCVLNCTDFIFGIKISWDNRHQLHTFNATQLSCHGNYSDTSITPLSLDLLISYLAWHFHGTLNISQIIRYYGYWVCLKLYWINVWYGDSFRYCKLTSYLIAKLVYFLWSFHRKLAEGLFWGITLVTMTTWSP